MIKKILLILLLSTSLCYAANEDLSTYSENDPNGDISCTGETCTISTMLLNIDAQCYKDYTASHFGNFDIDFTVDIGAQIGSGGYGGVLALCETADYSISEAATANECLYVGYWSDSDTETWYMEDFESDNFESVADDNVTAARYFTFTRTGTTCTLNIYSDSGRSSHISGSPLTDTGCPTTSYRYLYVAMTAEAGGSISIDYAISGVNLNEAAATRRIISIQ